jgi:hypothetical protein
MPVKSWRLAGIIHKTLPDGSICNLYAENMPITANEINTTNKVIASPI